MAEPKAPVIVDFPDIRHAALSLLGQHFDIVPLLPNSKRPLREKDWNKRSYGPSDFDQPCNIGLMLGVESADSTFLIAFDIDVDDPIFIRRVLHAVGPGAPVKRGSKGATVIARTLVPYTQLRKDGKYFDKVYGKEQDRTIEIMSTGFQTVIPPSIHPHTNKPYEWLRSFDGMPKSWSFPTLHHLTPTDLPLVTEWTVREVIAAAETPDLAFLGLGSLVWKGPDQGGNVHDTMIEAVASFAAKGWPDDVIEGRVLRAVANLLAGLPESLRFQWSDSNFRRDLAAALKGARAKEFDKTAQKDRRPIDRVMADELARDLGGTDNLWATDSGQFRVYSNGHWPMMPDLEVRNKLARRFPNSGNGTLTSAWRLLTTALPAPREPPYNLSICLANGTLDLAPGGTLRSWSPDDLIMSQLPFAWEPDVPCPLYERFVARTFQFEGIPADDLTRAVETFEEFLGYTLVNSTRFQKMLVLSGPPASGKSTLTEIMRLLHDPRAVTAVALNQISEPNMLAQLDGTLLNISGEARVYSHADDETIKKVISGDPVLVKRLYQNSASTRITARLVVACNEMFGSVDASGAMERRLLLLRCDNPVPEAERDPFLATALKSERAGILTRAVAGLRRLFGRGRFLPPSYSARDLDQFSEANNTALAWFREHTNEGLAQLDLEHKFEKKPTLTTDLYRHYHEWTVSVGQRPVSASTWGQRVAQLGYPTIITKVGGKAVRTRNLSLANDGGKF